MYIVTRGGEGAFRSFHLRSFSGDRTISSTVEGGYIFVAHIGTYILEFYYCYEGRIPNFFELLIYACVNFVFVKFIGHI